MIKYKLFSYIFISLIFLIFSTITVRSEWTQYQFSPNSSGFFPTNNSFDSTIIINLTNQNNGSSFQPLVSDLNGDDVNEIVVFGINNIFVYNSYLNLKTQYNLGGNILGQPALFNVSGNKGLELMLSLNVSDVHYFIMYNYSNTFTTISNITISNNLTGSGMKCTSLNSTKSCVFMDNIFFIHVVNVSNANNPIDNATQVSNSPNRANTTNYETVPAISDFDNDGNKEALFWNDNDAGDRFGFVVFDLLDKTKDVAPSAFLLYSTNQKAGHPIFVKGGSDSLTQIAFASNTATTGQIRNFNGTGTNLASKWVRSLSLPDLALVSASLLAVDCDNNGFEDIAGMAYGGAATRSRLFCYNGDNTQLYSINNIEPTDIIERTTTAVNISGNSAPEVVTYKGIYSFNGSLIYGFAGLGTQAPVPIDVNNDGKLDFLWTNSTNGVVLFASNDSLAPTFSNLTKSPEPSFKNQIVYINVTWQDPAGVEVAFIAHNGTENWVNYTADNSFGNNIYNLTVAASNSNYTLKVIGWYSTANDTAGNRNTTSIQTFTVSNRAPNATNVLLNNTDFLNRTNGSLIGSWQFSDIDGDAQQSNETIWYINGTEKIEFRNFTFISHTNTTKTQNWTFSVRAFDGTNFSDFVNSTSLTIQKLSPTVSNVILSNSDFLNRTNGTLIANWSQFDFDNNPLNNRTSWYVNGIENESFRNQTLITHQNTSKGQNWIFSVQVFNADDSSDFVNSNTITIDNAVPTHSTPIVTSNDNQNRKNGTLTCSNQSTNDLDNDIVTNFIKWYKNNVLIDTAINSTILNVGNYSKNDNITCDLAPNDGTINGTALNSTNFTILNAVPLLNKSVQNESWNENSATTINLNTSFVDIDVDNLTYNFTIVSNIIISINNNTGIATLTPDADFNGIRNVLFFAFDGTNITSSNNITLTVNDVPEPSPPSSPSSGGGGGGGGSGGLAGGKYICDLNWECEEWIECIEGKQTRKCKLVQVPNFISLVRCPQHIIPEQSRDCEVPVIKETCDDKIQNQNEEGIDCGGPCGPCFTVEQKENADELRQQSLITGQVVTETEGGNIYLIITAILLAGAITFYARFSHKRIFRRKNLTKEEMEKLNRMLNYDMFKREK